MSEAVSADHFLPYKIYLYECADGIFRQRCGRHVETVGTLRAVRKFRSADPGGRWGCIMCGTFTDDEGIGSDG